MTMKKDPKIINLTPENKTSIEDEKRKLSLIDCLYNEWSKIDELIPDNIKDKDPQAPEKKRKND